MAARLTISRDKTNKRKADAVTWLMFSGSSNPLFVRFWARLDRGVNSDPVFQALGNTTVAVNSNKKSGEEQSRIIPNIKKSENCGAVAQLTKDAVERVDWPE